MFQADGGPIFWSRVVRDTLAINEQYHIFILIVKQHTYRLTYGDGTMATHDDNLTDVRTIKASEFKAKCLKLMDEVADSGVEIVITKNGRPVSRLVPYRDEEPSMFGRDRDRIRILGDIISPLEVDWDEERELALIQGKTPDKP